MIGATFSLLSCDLFDDIYDDSSAIASDESGQSKTVTLSDGSIAGSYSVLNATSYTNWVYVNLKDGTSETHEVGYDRLVYYDGSGEEAVWEYRHVALEATMPDEWTFALHRYDCKSNGGSAYETESESLSDFRAAVEEGYLSTITEDMFIEDEESMISIDMSGMMSSILGYAETLLNTELGKWMYIDTSNMPPDYYTSDKVYLLKDSEGVISAVIFTGYSNPAYYDTKGYISFDYIYSIATFE